MGCCELAEPVLELTNDEPIPRDAVAHAAETSDHFAVRCPRLATSLLPAAGLLVTAMRVDASAAVGRGAPGSGEASSAAVGMFYRLEAPWLSRVGAKASGAIFRVMSSAFGGASSPSSSSSSVATPPTPAAPPPPPPPPQPLRGADADLAFSAVSMAVAALSFTKTSAPRKINPGLGQPWQKQQQQQHPRGVGSALMLGRNGAMWEAFHLSADALGALWPSPGAPSASAGLPPLVDGGNRWIFKPSASLAKKAMVNLESFNHDEFRSTTLLGQAPVGRDRAARARALADDADAAADATDAGLAQRQQQQLQQQQRQRPDLSTEPPLIRPEPLALLDRLAKTSGAVAAGRMGAAIVTAAGTPPIGRTAEIALAMESMMESVRAEARGENAELNILLAANNDAECTARLLETLDPRDKSTEALREWQTVRLAALLPSPLPPSPPSSHGSSNSIDSNIRPEMAREVVLLAHGAALWDEGRLGGAPGGGGGGGGGGFEGVKGELALRAVRALLALKGSTAPVGEWPAARAAAAGDPALEEVVARFAPLGRVLAAGDGDAAPRLVDLFEALREAGPVADVLSVCQEKGLAAAAAAAGAGAGAGASAPSPPPPPLPAAPAAVHWRYCSAGACCDHERDVSLEPVEMTPKTILDVLGDIFKACINMLIQTELHALAEAGTGLPSAGRRPRAQDESLVRACTGCLGGAWFCDIACQRAAWKAGHKRLCPLLAAMKARREQLASAR